MRLLVGDECFDLERAGDWLLALRQRHDLGRLLPQAVNARLILQQLPNDALQTRSATVVKQPW